MFRPLCFFYCHRPALRMTNPRRSPVRMIFVKDQAPSPAARGGLSLPPVLAISHRPIRACRDCPAAPASVVLGAAVGELKPSISRLFLWSSVVPSVASFCWYCNVGQGSTGSLVVSRGVDSGKYTLVVFNTRAHVCACERTSEKGEREGEREEERRKRGEIKREL